MTIEEYDQLDEDEKIEILWKNGQYLIHVEILEQTFIVFKLWRFYAEIWYDPASEVICQLRTFNDHKGLTPYLNGFQSTSSI
ncbi:hypothetical protein [Spirosoma pollinicola]|uniref:Uncharacterized protein n=1 Tax=Spirosoma pollinicola TaxID=2057025 RepID=A0A2K8Z8E4_9BACT|nr:hypothetical protein [Spirosoma pollinicola]AUD06120.1 hypothetical protein CWM47_32315 [Spirosoma pollinicola]